MNSRSRIFSTAIVALSLIVVFTARSDSVELDPKVLSYKLPDQISWGPVTPAGNQQAVLFGDPAKPGLYGVMTRTGSC